MSSLDWTPPAPLPASSTELEALALVLEDSGFRAFFDEYRPQVAGVIAVRLPRPEELPPGIQACFTRKPEWNSDVVVDQLPPTLEKATDVAHEYGHAVLDTQGYPGVWPALGYGRMAAAVVGLVQDPLVIRLLKPYFEDLKAQWEAGQRLSAARLQTVFPQRLTPVDRTQRVLAIAETILEWRELVGDATATGPYLYPAAESWDMDIAVQALELADAASVRDFSDTNATIAFVSDLRDRYGLDEWVSAPVRRGETPTD